MVVEKRVDMDGSFANALITNCLVTSMLEFDMTE